METFAIVKRGYDYGRHEKLITVPYMAGKEDIADYVKAELGRDALRRYRFVFVTVQHLRALGYDGVMEIINN